MGEACEQSTSAGDSPAEDEGAGGKATREGRSAGPVETTAEEGAPRELQAYTTA